MAAGSKNRNKSKKANSQKRKKANKESTTVDSSKANGKIPKGKAQTNGKARAEKQDENTFIKDIPNMILLMVLYSF